MAAMTAERFRKAASFKEYLGTVDRNRDLWMNLHRRVKLHPDDAGAAGNIQRPVRLVALSEDWCGDAVNTLPVIAALTGVSDLLDFRVLGRDENLDLMDAHLTGGRSRSIPIVIAYDSSFRELGWWVRGPGRSRSGSWTRDSP